MQTVANAEQLAFLKRSIEGWNQWRWDHREVEPDLSNMTLRHANLRDANLSNTDLSNATLNYANLSSAILSSANLSSAILSYANLKEATLSYADLSGANLRSVNLSSANLRNADLSSVNLRSATLRDADLSGANLSGADLSNADLLGTQCLGTNFTGVTLTGACIEDWNTNSETCLDSVICDYIYLKDKQQEYRPVEGNFAPGDFARLFQKARVTLDLVFRKGIDWHSFADTLQAIRDEQIDIEPNDPKANITVRSIENFNDGSLVIHVNVPDSLDKAQLEFQFEEAYEKNLAAKEREYRHNFQAEDERLDRNRQHNASLERIIDILANHSVDIDNIDRNIGDIQEDSADSVVNVVINSTTDNSPDIPDNTIQDNATPNSNQEDCDEREAAPAESNGSCVPCKSEA